MRGTLRGTFRSATRVPALIALLGAACWVGLTSSAHAQSAPTHPTQARSAQARPASLDNTWACSVPAGYTYDQVANRLNVCSPSGFAYSYHLRTPSDGVWACTVPSGFTYDQVANRLNVCSPSGFAYSYHLRTPSDGVWACTVPSGFTYDRVAYRLNVCDPSGFAYSYHLIG